MTTANIKSQVFAIAKQQNRQKAIKQLLNLSMTTDKSNQKFVQEVTLYVMEQDHDWENIRKFAQSWKHSEWVQSFLNRMRKRVNQQSPNLQSKSIYQQITRLAEKYWKITSPKKQAKNYIFKEFQQKPSIVPTNTEQMTQSQSVPITNRRITGAHKFNLSKQKEKKQQPIQTSQNNILKRIKFNKYIPSKEQALQQIPILPHLQSRKKIPVSPQKPSQIEKKQIKIRYSNEKQSHKSDKQDFSFSAIRQRQKQPLLIQNPNLNDSFNDMKQVKPIQKELLTIDPPISNGIQIKSKLERSVDKLRYNSIYPELGISQKKSSRKLLQQSEKTEQQLFTKQQKTLIDYSVQPNKQYENKLNKLGFKNFSIFNQLYPKLMKI